MKEILITSSALIAALLVLRRVFRRSISRRIQYALWGLVLLRLLVPVNLPALEHNVLTATEPVTRNMESLYLAPNRVDITSPTGAPFIATDSPQVAVGPATPDNTLTFSQRDAYNTPVENSTEYQRQIPLRDLFRPVWYTGCALMAVWFLLSNLLFWRKLRRRRTPYPVENCARRVYLVEEGLPSPCLFGLFQPAIYLTPAAVSSPEALRHVLAHEETHARHLDPLWSLLRAVCLAVYWFDPLVWAAAVASRNDCELACDEGAILRLGEAERIPYGKTLLSLIPVRRGPSNPLLSATTMTAGKRQLKDRVTRIAQNRRTVGLALFAVIALSAAICAACFTGAAVSQAPEDVDSTAAKVDGPLTAEEMGYFNEEFFSGEDGFNLRGQFLTCLYGAPEDLPFFGIFYNGVGSPDVTDEAERRAAAQAEYGGEDPGLDLTRFTTAELEAALLEYTGLTLDQTNRVDLDGFTYLPEYDAYYHFHGDTNAVPVPDFFAGEREGDTVRLYYEEFRFGGYSVFCLELEEREEVGYWFRSHTFSEMPAIPPVYPEGEPWMTIPLDGLEPYRPHTEEVTIRSGDIAELFGSWDAYGQTFLAYRSTDGNCYAAFEDGDSHKCFLTLPENTRKVTMDDFYQLLGHDGVSISYSAQKDGEYYTTFNDYCTLDENGEPFLLARAYGDDVIKRDLDGDGQMELASAGIHDVQIFFQRDGQLYEADVLPLLAEQWTDPASFYPTYWDKYGRSLYLNAEVPFPDASLPEEFGGGPATGTAVRQLYFDGENLRLYRDSDRPVTDHVMEGLAAPEDVLDAARRMVHDDYEYMRTHTGVTGGDGETWGTPAEYDDWRLEITGGPWTETLGGQSFEVWNINYELHTTTPERIILAGSCYLTEDAWYCPTYPGCTYLYFLLEEDGSRNYLYSAMENDCAPGTELFRTDMAYRLDGMGVVPLTEVEADVLADMILMNEASFLNNMAEREDGGEIIDHLRTYLTARWGTPLDGLTELSFQYSGNANGWDHEEMYQYYVVQYFDGIRRPDLTEGGAALWERLTEQGARALPENQLIQPSRIDGETLLSMLSPRSLNLWGTYPEEEQEAVLAALDAFHNRGPQELQMDLRDAVQTVARTRRDLDEHGAALFQKLLDRTGIHPDGLINTATNHLGSAITNALHHWRQNADPHEYDHHAIAYYLLDTQRGGSSCTVHLLVSWGDYQLTEDGYELVTGGDRNAMAVSFSFVNGRYQATEIWEPHGGGLYEPEIRACFPEESADIVFSSDGLKYEAIREALDNYLEMDVKAWYKMYQQNQAGR